MEIIESIKTILIGVSIVFAITLVVSYVVSKMKKDNPDEISHADNLIKTPEPKIVRTTSRKVSQPRAFSGSRQSSNSKKNVNRKSNESRTRQNKSSRTSGTNVGDKKNTPRMQIVTDLKNPNKKI